ncbi:unnamed protein product [marine sediment metagenome]|uniref:Uncharacterized protein n=1 Tax=marine sediment metagenome TaxID=412755 RepID=X0ZAK6_9ZZZZ
MLIKIISSNFVTQVNTLKISEGVLGWEEDEYDNECEKIVQFMQYWRPYKIKEYCKHMGWGYYPQHNKSLNLTSLDNE